jgi:hypothetical protein
LTLFVRLFIAAALCALLLLSACQSTPSPDTSAPDSTRAEVQPRALSLSPPLDRADMEISGLTWHGDTLVVLPQYPARGTAEAERVLYGIARADLESAVRDSTVSLDPFPIPLHGNGFNDHAHVYEGCEAIAFRNGEVFVLVEGNGDGAGMEAYLIRGTVEPDLRGIHLRASDARSLPVQARLRNMSYEALTVRGDTVLAFFEANGARVNATPQALRFADPQQALDPLSFPTLEYRLTDATALDADRRFWVTNYFYPGERDVLTPGPDSLALRYGTGATHQASEVVERLVEYHYTPRGIRRTDTPPVWLQLGGDTGRNWEGLARFNDGFLMATDKFPETILAYVPRP